MAIVLTYKSGVVIDSTGYILYEKIPVSEIRVKLDDGSGDCFFKCQNDERYKNFPVGTKVQVVLNKGKPDGVQGFNC